MLEIPNIAVLITCHNRKDKTLACLQRLFEQDGLDTLFKIQLFLVDDGSTDGTAEAIQAAFPQVQLIKGDGTLFWNGGMYRAWFSAIDSKIEFSHFFWLNDDTFLFPESLRFLWELSNKFSNSIIVGSTQSKNGSLTYGGRSKSGKLVYSGSNPTTCELFNGNIVLIPLAVYEIVGTNDIHFKHSLGDFDYGLRAGKLGIKSIVAPGVLGICEGHAEFPTWCNPKKSLFQRISVFRSSLGQNPYEYFVYDLRHFGVFSATFHFITIHIRLIFPVLWTYSKKK